MSKKYIVLSFILLLALSSRAQTIIDTLYFDQIIEEAIRTDIGSPVMIKNAYIQQRYSSSKLFKTLKNTYGDQIFNAEGQLIIHRDFLISNSIFSGNVEFTDYYFEHSLNLYFNEMKGLILSGLFNEVNISFNTLESIRMLDSRIADKIQLSKNKTTYIKLEGNEFDNSVSMLENDLSESLLISKSTFKPTQGIACDQISDSLTFHHPFTFNLQLDIKGKGGEVIIEDNTFLAENPYQRIHIRGVITELDIENNLISSTTDLTGLTVEERFIMSHNQFDSYIAFNDLIFPEFFNLVRWDQISNYKIAVIEKIRSSDRDFWMKLVECDMDFMSMEDKEQKIAIPYHGMNISELDDADAFEKLIYSYKSLYTIYTTRGDLESANACYAEMKEIQRRRLKYIYETNGGFANYFRWQLLVLLKAYTNHGTDPALSMVISVYVILIFAIFYFFFPSEWDITSKSKLISDFKEFIERNEKGYFKPFLTVAGGFIISMFNAFTLSLNSFITLGFGNIPAKGVARYICVLEGFIGWFLLSIFTVALINQVLA